MLLFSLRKICAGFRAPAIPNIQKDTDGWGNHRQDSYDYEDDQYNRSVEPIALQSHIAPVDSSTGILRSANNEVIDIYKTEFAKAKYGITEVVQGHATSAKQVIEGVLATNADLKTYLAVARGASALFQFIPEQLVNAIDWCIQREAFSLRIPQDSELHPVFIQFINDKVPPKAQKSGTVKTAEDLKRGSRNNNSWERSSPVDSNLIFFNDLDYQGGQIFEYEGEPFSCTKDEDGSIRVWHMASQDPIKAMLTIVHTTAVEQRKASAIDIYFAVNYSGTFRWNKHNKPAKKRDIELVCLEPEDRDRLLNSLDDYFDPHTNLYYSRRGVPKRNGILLHGPMGTGKTSLTQAVASRYNLNIRIISLSAPGMTDVCLAELFENLDAKDLLLLEDVDCAGITTRRDRLSGGHISGAGDRINSAQNRNISNEETATEISANSDQRYYTPRESSTSSVRQHQNAILTPATNNSSNTLQPSSVTLSGLLNVIDGVNSPEGHVLFMTSNYPEHLDEALTRPGRINLKIKLDYASRTQLRDLFYMIYMPRPGERPHCDPKTVPVLADQFVNIVPAGGFTPSEVVNEHLIPNRTDPQRAVDKALEWIVANRATLERRGIVLTGHATPIPAPSTDSNLRTSPEMTRDTTTDTITQTAPTTADVEPPPESGDSDRIVAGSRSLNVAVQGDDEDSEIHADGVRPLVHRSTTIVSAARFSEPRMGEILEGLEDNGEGDASSDSGREYYTILQPRPSESVQDIEDNVRDLDHHVANIDYDPDLAYGEFVPQTESRSRLGKLVDKFLDRVL